MALAKPEYSVLIRTFNSFGSLSCTLGCLSNQVLGPSQYIFVDSGSTDATRSLFPPGAVVHDYVGHEFNYSSALNQGLEHVATDYVFVVSSHTLLINREAVSFALDLLESRPDLGAAYFYFGHWGPLRYETINKDNFNGRNGLWNWCSIIRMELLRRRQFRPEVFTAEDQEWAKWLFEEEGKSIAQIHGAGAINANARGLNLRKLRNEYLAVAYYVNRSLLEWPNIREVFWSAITPANGIRLRHRLSQLLLAWQLIGCRSREPKAKSKYF